jgi:hypothetical protein
MPRPDIVDAINAGWDYVDGADLPAPPECVSVVCDEAADRYARIERQRAFVMAAMAAITQRN